MGASLSRESHVAYDRTCDRYRSFCSETLHISPAFPLSVGHVLLYISSLHASGTSPATIRSSLSALNYTHQLDGGNDIYENFCIKKVLSGLNNIAPTQDLRLPITEEMVMRLQAVLPLVCQSEYLVEMFSAMYALAFRAFLRVGEMCLSGNNQKNILQIEQIAMDNIHGTVSITFHHFKHKSDPLPFVLSIDNQPQSINILVTMANYLRARGFNPGPLFSYKNKPISRSFFAKILQQCISRVYPGQHISSHSFRIGAASACLQKGYTYPQIQRMGRWKSDAFMKYMRVQSFKV